MYACFQILMNLVRGSAAAPPRPPAGRRAAADQPRSGERGRSPETPARGRTQRQPLPRAFARLLLHAMPDSSISDRKADHIELCAEGDVGFKQTSTLLGCVRLVHDALPDMKLGRRTPSAATARPAAGAARPRSDDRRHREGRPAQPRSGEHRRGARVRLRPGEPAREARPPPGRRRPTGCETSRTTAARGGSATSAWCRRAMTTSDVRLLLDEAGARRRSGACISTRRWSSCSRVATGTSSHGQRRSSASSRAWGFPSWSRRRGAGSRHGGPAPARRGGPARRDVSGRRRHPWVGVETLRAEAAGDARSRHLGCAVRTGGSRRPGFAPRPRVALWPSTRWWPREASRRGPRRRAGGGPGSPRRGWRAPCSRPSWRGAAARPRWSFEGVEASRAAGGDAPHGQPRRRGPAPRPQGADRGAPELARRAGTGKARSHKVRWGPPCQRRRRAAPRGGATVRAPRVAAELKEKARRLPPHVLPARRRACHRRAGEREPRRLRDQLAIVEEQNASLKTQLASDQAIRELLTPRSTSSNARSPGSCRRCTSAEGDHEAASRTGSRRGRVGARELRGPLRRELPAPRISCACACNAQREGELLCQLVGAKSARGLLHRRGLSGTSCPSRLRGRSRWRTFRPSRSAKRANEYVEAVIERVLPHGGAAHGRLGKAPRRPPPASRCLADRGPDSSASSSCTRCSITRSAS